jgi:uncharacterized protein with GYD domain
LTGQTITVADAVRGSGLPAGNEEGHAHLHRAYRLDRSGRPGVQGQRRSVRGRSEPVGVDGVRFTDVYWTLGAHDIVGIVEAPDDQSLAAGLLAVAGQGNIRTTTLRAFSADEMKGVISKVG